MSRPVHTTVRAGLVRRPNAPFGFTLIEMMIAVTLMLFIFAMVVPFLQTQMHQLGDNAGNLDALQNARFAQNTIDRELRVAGAGVVPAQSFLVQAAPMAVSFNADLVTADSLDPTAVYYDPNVDTSTTHALPAADAVTLPGSVAFVYPGMDYVSAPGVLSTAETISYWLVADPTQPIANMYILYRQVNAAAPTVVSDGIYVAAGTAFFQYYKITSAGALDSIPNASLPLEHVAVVHGSPADTGQSAQVDSIYAVKMTVVGMFDDPVKGPIYRSVTTMTKLLNAGLAYASECGQPPIAVNTPTATEYTDTSGTFADSVTVTWNASPDQNGGEENVEFYMIYRRTVGTADWGNPVETVPAGTPTYEYSDPTAPNLAAGQYQYDVLAQNCTPSNSTDAISNTVTVP